MAGTTLDLTQIIDADTLASSIADKWTTWDAYRQQKVEEWKELRNYLYATDTTTTSNAILPWSNNTTTPKLTQIMDNLHANYFAAMFPTSNWFRWEAMDQSANTKQKKQAINSYMKTKLRQSKFINTVSDLLYDYIQYGNCFAMVKYEDNFFERMDGDNISGYTGPVLERISPYDIVFDPTAADFTKTPKIIRSVVTLGELHKMAKNNPDMEATLMKMLDARQSVSRAGGDGNISKAEGFIADGFGSITNYYNSNYVEILTFYGDIYDVESGDLHVNKEITIVDRAYVVSNKDNQSWLGHAPIFHAGWRPRPDNLYAMGPLDNLVGMQYRIDHLENLKADVFDQIAYPILKIRGDVPDFEFEPNARIYLGDEGDVNYLAPDATALNADTQIAILEAKMEEMAGAPKQAMGFRTAGEKTAFEVQALDNAANRIFAHKTANFDRTFIEPVLNAMLEVARRNIKTLETIRVTEESDTKAIFKTIKREDILGNGSLIPMGSRHFTERAQRIQNLMQLYQVKAADPSVAPHLSGKALARILAEELGEVDIYSENIAIFEQAETQQALEEIQVQMEEQRQIAIDEGL